MIKENLGIRKSDIINRRMFIIGAAKIIIFTGIVARLFLFKLVKIKNILHFQIKTGLENGNSHPQEGTLLIILEI